MGFIFNSAAGTVLQVVFAEHPHAVSERIGNLRLCLKKVPGTQVAPNVTVNVMLVELSDIKLGMIFSI